MSNKKSAAKVKEPVKIRFKQLKNGNKSIYLARWNNCRQKGEYEFLKELYIVPDSNSPILKAANDSMLKLARAIPAQRIVELQNNTHGFTGSTARSKVNVIDYIKTPAEKKRAKSGKERGTHQSYMALARRISEYGGTKTAFKQINKTYCQGFPEFLKTAANLNGGEENKPLHENTPCLNPVIGQAFLFSCYSGLRYSDVCNLTWGKLQRDNGGDIFIKFVQEKTKKQEYLPIPQKALNNLPDRAGAKDTDFIFHLPSGCHVNIQLREWAFHAGITKHIHFHVARHTYPI